MREDWIEKIIYQTRISMHISQRDTRKRVASTAMMLGVVTWADHLNIGIILSLCLILIEFLAILLRYLMPKKDNDRALAISFCFWVINWLSMFGYLAFTLILIASSSLAMVIAGYLWLFGIYVHTSNSFSFLPIYNWSLMAPAFLIAFPIFYITSRNEIGPSPDVEWMIAAGMMVIYIVNTIETMEKHNDTQAALAQARFEALTRMNELEFLTRHDKLTGLRNRVAFDEDLAGLLLSKSKRQGLTIFLIDLDDFKPINDSYSHMAGDAVLVAAANTLTRVAGPEAIVARLGGDEFAVIVQNILSDAAAIRLGTYFVRGINAPIRYKDKQLRVGASIGIARYGSNLDTAKDLLSGADQAMYSAKADPINKSRLYDPKSFPPRPTLEDRNALYRAIHEGQIIPYYQPKVCAKSFEVLGFEALSRWNHPNLGLIPPVDFMPHIKEFGLHGELLMRMARQVLLDMSQTHAMGLYCGQVSINVPELTLATLSGRSELASLINQYPDLKHFLTLEITEDVFISRSGDMIQRSIKAFRDEGIRVSLDDFGTGFASFQHLRLLEFDELKLDKDFVAGLGSDPDAAVLVGGIMNIGKGLGIQVVAEGVETTEQLKRLVDLGCDIVQGHLFGPAVPAREALKLLQSGSILIQEASESAA